MDCSLPVSFWLFQARILEWVAISLSMVSSPPREGTHVSCIGRWILYHWATREAPFILQIKEIRGNLSQWFWDQQHLLDSVQLLNCVWLFATPWTATRQASLSITNSWSLLKLMSIESVMPSNCLILCRPLHLLPSIFPSIRVFSSESALGIRWPKDWSFSSLIMFLWLTLFTNLSHLISVYGQHMVLHHWSWS